jgi:hypothetical protein
MSSGPRVEYVHSVMEPLELYRVLEKYDHRVDFHPVPFRDLPTCESGGQDCFDLESQAVISWHHLLPYPRCQTHTFRMAVNGSCLGWQLRLLTAPEARYAEKLTVEILMIDKGF